MALGNQSFEREELMVLQLLTEMLAAECGEDFIQLDWSGNGTASKQRLAGCVTTTLTRRALCDISFGHLIIV